MVKGEPFTFEISLSILNHLGRNLYRSFVTVLGEAISNSWDADAKNVWIYIDREKNILLVKDDGEGMNGADFQNKFLKIGYSKRKEDITESPNGRPYIGRKGIGKLALLSCAKKITVISRKDEKEEYTGGVINNVDLDDAIKEDLVPSDYELDMPDKGDFEEYLQDHKKGTLVYFEDLHEGIKNREDYLKKIIALYFRFSLIDKEFNIYLNNELITLKELEDFSEKTEFLWTINDFEDPYINQFLTDVQERKDLSLDDKEISGFIASVEKPRYLKINGADEKISIDLFVNGRLREKDIIKHIPTDRLAADYLYGQIHVNSFDGENDRFTSSREGIVAGDPRFKEVLDEIKSKFNSILEDWDKWRGDHKKEGDAENDRISRKERTSKGLFDAVSEEYEEETSNESDSETILENKEKVKGWVNDLEEDAKFNLTSYAESFISENLVRKYITENSISPSGEQQEIDRWRKVEIKAKRVANLSIDIRQSNDDLFYLDMEHLVKLAEPPASDGYPDTLLTDEKNLLQLEMLLCTHPY